MNRRPRRSSGCPPSGAAETRTTASPKMPSRSVGRSSPSGFGLFQAPRRPRGRSDASQSRTAEPAEPFGHRRAGELAGLSAQVLDGYASRRRRPAPASEGDPPGLRRRPGTSREIRVTGRSRGGSGDTASPQLLRPCSTGKPLRRKGRRGVGRLWGRRRAGTRMRGGRSRRAGRLRRSRGRRPASRPRSPARPRRRSSATRASRWVTVRGNAAESSTCRPTRAAGPDASRASSQVAEPASARASDRPWVDRPVRRHGHRRAFGLTGHGPHPSATAADRTPPPRRAHGATARSAGRPAAPGPPRRAPGRRSPSAGRSADAGDRSPGEAR